MSKKMTFERAKKDVVETVGQEKLFNFESLKGKLSTEDIEALRRIEGFRVLKEAVLTAANAALIFDLNTLKPPDFFRDRKSDFSKAIADLREKELVELQHIHQRTRFIRAAYEIGKLDKDIDFDRFEHCWPELTHPSLANSHSRGKKSPLSSNDRELFKSNRYDLGEKIGEGSFGVVFKGNTKTQSRDMGEDEIIRKTDVAIKILKSTWDQGAPGNEAKLIDKVKHPHVIDVLYIGRLETEFDLELLQRLENEFSWLGCPAPEDSLPDGPVYLVMEWVNGAPLQKYTDRDHLQPEDQILLWMEQCCEGMEAVHKEDIIHRDLKPANLFTMGNDSENKNILKIGDFGLAKDSATESSTSVKPGNGTDPKEAALSQFSGLGTPLYMAPEQESGKAEPRSDIYSFGATFYHLLTGSPPLEPKNKQGEELKRMHREDTPEDPVSINPAVSRETSDLIMRCLEKEPESRFESFAEIREELNAIKNRTERGKENGLIKQALEELYYPEDKIEWVTDRVEELKAIENEKKLRDKKNAGE